MKRKIKYTIIFFICCSILLGISMQSNKIIMNHYSGKLLNELESAFKSDKNNFIIDGSMLNTYITIFNPEIKLEGNNIKEVSTSENYIVNKQNDILNVEPTLDSSNKALKLNTLSTITILLKYKTIVVNLATIIVGLSLYMIYMRRIKVNIY